MRRLRLLALGALALLLAPPAAARGGRGPRRASADRGVLAVDGEAVPVRWIDGDTVRLLGGRHAGRTARLHGVNALETFGPVHRYGTAGPRALLAVAKDAARVAAAAGGPCETRGAEDRYRRLLLDCPDAAAALVRTGHAMAYGVDGPPEARLVALMREAQAARRGMWAGGVPPLVPTSVHSASERGLGPQGAYDRLADTRTGVTAAHPHRRVYLPCEEVCVGEGLDRACMTYVPFERRYRDRPACLRR